MGRQCVYPDSPFDPTLPQRQRQRSCLTPTHPSQYLYCIQANASRPNQVPYVKQTPQLLGGRGDQYYQGYWNRGRL